MRYANSSLLLALGRPEGHRTPSATGDWPTPGEVLTEIGLLLTIHLARGGGRHRDLAIVRIA